MDISLLLYRVIFLIIVGYLLLFYFIIIAGRSLFPTGTTLFFAWQAMALLGTISLIDLTNLEIGVRRLSMMSLGLLMFAIGAFIANREKQFHPHISIPLFRQKQISVDLVSGSYFALLLIALVSIAVGALYFQRLGYSVVLRSLQDYITYGDLSSSILIYSTGRRLVHGSEGIYLASGYSMQFFAILLPMVFFCIYVRLKFVSTLRDRLISFGLFCITIIFLTVPGNRSIILNFFLIFFLLGTFHYGPLGKYAKSKWWTLLIPVSGVAIFYVITYLAGRTGGNTVSERLLAPLGDLFNRAFIIPSENQLSFSRLFSDYESLRWGKGWYDSLLILLPGTKESTLAGNLAYLVSGDKGGSAPPDFWNSVWWNFGWIGIVVIPLSIGYLLQRYSIYFFTSKKTLTKILVIYVSFFYLREITDPIDIFQQGFITLMILWGILTIVKLYDQRVFRKNMI